MPSPYEATFFAVAVLTLVASCTPARGQHPDSDVPEDQTAVLGPEYEGGEVEPGELRPQEPEASSARGTPALGTKAEWSPANTDPPQWRITAVEIDIGLAEICGIDEADTHFDYDSAKLDAEAKSRVTQIAHCFVEGPLGNRNVVIIGHADPRGSDTYNRELGLSRAESVAKALTSEGLAPTRIILESHGEAEAHADPDEWPDDRRVDLQIAD